MKYQTVNQIRDKFLDFFVAREHTVLPSFPLVPHGDNSLLLINSGMAPMKAFFTGQEKPPSPRVVTCQKCIRTIDIDEVGKDARHGSFFEMLGNFSFADYFKAEVIPWAWEFLTKEMEIPADRLYISVYKEDDEAFQIWKTTVGIPEDRIYHFDKDENFWEHGVGPCGPCSEIHFDRGADRGCGKPDCAVGCDCDRYMEVWNLVFTQFDKSEDGSYSPLASTNIDTGMGLERLAIVLQDAPTIFDIDNIKSIRDEVMEMSDGSIPLEKRLVSANIIADHVRSVVFMASDGVLPSNEGRGYILRRLLRRAVRHGRSIGLERNAAVRIAETSIKAYCHAYPALNEKSKHILQAIDAEEGRFLETLDTGMNLLHKHINALKTSGATVLGGAEGFKLYDTFGFPPELTREILEDEGLVWDEDGFRAEMENQRNRARAARGVSNYMGADETVYHKLPTGLVTEFVGYREFFCDAEVLALIVDDEIANEATEGQNVAVVLNKTPLYAASGGQNSDTGRLRTDDGLHVAINDCIHAVGNNTVHIGEIRQGTLRVGMRVQALINMERRLDITRNHTATHMLQGALRAELGTHIEQAGSDVGTDRLRFDFTHMSPLTAEERKRIEDRINKQIIYGAPVLIQLTTPDEARKQGALALFGEKYGDTVRMVTTTAGSELCGGTHVESTEEIKAFRILSESGVASGVRRIEAVTGRVAIQLFRDESAVLAEVADMLRVKPLDVPARIGAILAENKEIKKEAAKNKAAAAGDKQEQAVRDILQSAEEYKGFSLIAAKLTDYGINELRTLSDKLKAELKSGCLILCDVNTESGSAQFLASAAEDAVKQGIHAGELVKTAAKLCGGGGGGKPNHAQAGGKDASKADEALQAALAKMKEMLG